MKHEAPLGIATVPSHPPSPMEAPTVDQPGSVHNPGEQQGVVSSNLCYGGGGGATGVHVGVVEGEEEAKKGGNRMEVIDLDLDWK